MMGGIKSMSAANFAVEIIRSLNKRHDKAGENAVDLEGIKHENNEVCPLLACVKWNQPSCYT
jgi:hypothetical protein